MISKLNLKFILNLFFSYFLNNLQDIHWKLVYFLVWWNKKLLKIVNFKIFFKKNKGSNNFFFYLRYILLYNQLNFFKINSTNVNQINNFFLYYTYVDSFKFLN